MFLDEHIVLHHSFQQLKIHLLHRYFILQLQPNVQIVAKLFDCY
jgi:hypothetical protein